MGNKETSEEWTTISCSKYMIRDVSDRKFFRIHIIVPDMDLSKLTVSCTGQSLTVESIGADVRQCTFHCECVIPPQVDTENITAIWMPEMKILQVEAPLENKRRHTLQ
ncbi:hypothetical protein T4B_10777 [Trichinella pseudospiralis]|uniref:SHSP domain-containing protein n=2 Tax=Trichinella pseudospiralis TaxID=6337 RepID=A0A0V1FYP3_TRIPS|nr:hypothetical protein T4E_5555 [Trichinella pseudospiralis]KRY77477.1 hypothetical protein T4A_3199 [Trichinella pseudospiralis]KRY91102.1 hypothetical protein T4D_11486 [Trichinella pseudospiralis]KRZ16981.1 hypothetical protein T4B_10777 [Trichinella pseudospiralis]KRZ44767.1 hypothetical protein T4C_4349 [Trichinella pseudospiralis]